MKFHLPRRDRACFRDTRIDVSRDLVALQGFKKKWFSGEFSSWSLKRNVSNQSKNFCDFIFLNACLFICSRNGTWSTTIPCLTSHPANWWPLENVSDSGCHLGSARTSRLVCLLHFPFAASRWLAGLIPGCNVFPLARR